MTRLVKRPEPPPPSKPVTCEQCVGEGSILKRIDGGSRISRICDKCKGTGIVWV